MEGIMIKFVLVSLFCVYFIISIPITIICFIAYFVSRLKCHKMHYNKYSNPCHNSGCRFSKYCEDYRHTYTAEEVTRINKLIEKL